MYKCPHQLLPVQTRVILASNSIVKSTIEANIFQLLLRQLHTKHLLLG